MQLNMEKPNWGPLGNPGLIIVLNGSRPTGYFLKYGLLVLVISDLLLIFFISADPKKRVFVRFNTSILTSDLIISEVAPEDQGVFCCVTDSDMNCFMLLAFIK